MITKPRFKRHFQVEVLPSGSICLLSESQHYVLEGEVYRLIVPLMDGDHTLDDIVQALEGRASVIQIQRAISRLEQAGYLVDGAYPTHPPEQQAYWDLNAHLNQNDSVQPLSSLVIGMQQFGTLPDYDYAEAFRTLGLTVKKNLHPEEPVELDIVLTDDYLQRGLEDFTAQARYRKRAWLLIKPVGASIWIGPLFTSAFRQDRTSACWACLSQRLSNNRLIERHVEITNHQNLTVPLAKAALPTTLALAMNMAATDVARWLHSGVSTLTNRVISMDTITFAVEHHTVVKRPQCNMCGIRLGSKALETAKIDLQHRPKLWTADGGHRSQNPQQTFEQYKHHISSITGPIKFLYREENSPLLNVYIAQTNLRRPDDSWERIYKSTQKRVSGKGLLDIQARVSALGEGLEHYSSLFEGDEIRYQASYNAIKDAAPHPYTYLGYSDWQYENRAEWNNTYPYYLRIPARFDENAKIDWTPVWSLTHETTRYLPTAYCYFGFFDEDIEPFTVVNSNGSAAGSSLEDAILQGFFELVERDGISLWWINRLKRPMIDLDSLNDPYIKSLKAFYASIGREFWLLDLTTDLNIPVFAAVTRRIDQPHETILVEFGAHFDAKIAMMRAITEINQVLPFSNDTSFYDQWKRRWCEEATIANQPYLAPDPSVPARKLQDYPVYRCDDLKEDVLYCVELLRKRGMEMLVLDQTRPDIGMPVAKVIVPELAFYLGRYGFNRLRTVPVEMGWLAKPLAETDYNREFLYL